MKISGVYMLKINSYYYIGCSTNIKRRVNRHYCELKKQKHHNNILQRSFNKYNNFNYFILKETVNDLFELEIEFIRKFKSKINLANLTNGGDSGPIICGGNNILSKERRTVELDTKIKNSIKNYHLNMKANKKIYPGFGKKQSDASKQLNRQAHLGKRNSPKTEFKFGNELKNKTVICNETLQIFKSAKDASLILGIKHYTVTHSARTNSKTRHNLSFRYQESV